MPDFETIPAKDLDLLIHKKNCFIIDLRMPDEYMERHIKGAVNIPYHRLGNCRSLPDDMELVLYCERAVSYTHLVPKRRRSEYDAFDNGKNWRDQFH